MSNFDPIIYLSVNVPLHFILSSMHTFYFLF